MVAWPVGLSDCRTDCVSGYLCLPTAAYELKTLVGAGSIENGVLPSIPWEMGRSGSRTRIGGDSRVSNRDRAWRLADSRFRGRSHRSQVSDGQHGVATISVLNDD